MTVESVQFAVFLAGTAVPRPAIVAATELFPDRFPNSFNEVGPEQSVATFTDANYQTTVGSAPGRHDIIISRVHGAARPGSLPVDLALVRAEYLDLIATFARNLGATRLAVVIKSGVPVRSAQDAVKLFREVAPGIQLPAGADEIDFKVNVPRQCRTLSQLKMNRLHRWHTTGMMTLLVGPGRPQPGKVQWLHSEEIDVNTDAEGHVESSVTEPLLKELYEEAVYLVGKGPEALEELLDAS